MTGPDPRNSRHPIRTRMLVLAGLMVLIGALVLAYCGWCDHERRVFQSAIQRYHDAGEPVLPEDFAPAVPDGPDNPVHEWRAAAEALKQIDPELLRRGDMQPVSVPLTEAEYSFICQLLKPSQEALTHSMAASRMTGKPDWRVRFATPSIDTNLADLTAQRALTLMLKRAALAAHYRGDDAEAMERLHEIVCQSRAMQRHPTMVAHLVAIGLEEIACDLAWTLGPELNTGSGGAGHPASRTQVRQLITDFLDDRPLREGQALAFRTARMLPVETTMRMAEGDFGAPAGVRPFARLISPRYYRDARIMLEWGTRLLKTAQSPDYPTACTQRAALSAAEPQQGVAHSMAAILGPADDRAILLDFRMLADDRLTALVLACHCYAADHGGQFPLDLSNLIPDYLPRIPSDPFTTGHAMRYRVATDPLVYSVGENGTDEGGSEKPINPNRPGARWEQLDLVVHLRLQPCAAPSMQPDGDGDATAATQAATVPATQPAIP